MILSAQSGVFPYASRTELLTHLREVLRAQQAHGVLVHGGTGMGKTALAHQLVADGPLEQAPLLISPTRGLAPAPYGALAPLLVGARAEQLATPLSALRAVLSFLRRRTAAGPTLVVVDDAHLLDAESSHLLAQLVMHRAISVAVFCRATTPVSTALLSLAEDGLLEPFALTPLTLPEVQGLCRSILGGDIERGVFHQLRRETAGNPLLLKLLLREAVRTGTLVESGGVWALPGAELTVPEALSDYVRSITLQVSAHERTALEVLALGEVVAFEELVRLSSEAAVASLLNQGYIDALADERGFARSAQPLFSRILRSLVPMGRSVSLFRSLTRPPVPVHGRDEPLPLRGRIRHAVWAVECGQPVADEHLLDLAARALTSADPRSALALAIAVRSPTSAVAADILRASALFDLSREDEARDVGAGLLERAGTPELVRVAAELELRLLLAGRADADLGDAVMERWERALGSLEPASDGSALAAEDQLRVARAFGTNRTGDYADTVASLTPMVDAGTGDVRSRALALSLLGEALGALGRNLDGRQRSAAALQLVEQQPDVLLDLHGAVFLQHLSLLVHSGDLAGLDAELAAYAPELTEDYALVSGGLAVLEAAAEIRRGHFTSGLEKIRPALVALERSDRAALLPYALALATWAAAALEQEEPATRWAARYREIGYRGAEQLALLGEAFIDAAQVLLAGGTGADRLLEHAVEARARSWFSCEKDILELATFLGDAGSPRLLLTVSTRLDGPEARLLHTYASAVLSRDASALVASADRAELLQKYLLATEATDRAMMLFAGAGDGRGYRELTPVVRRRRALVDGRVRAEPEGSPLTSALTLTARERELAMLALDGLSNRAIAQRLTVSVRTVEGHLYRLFSKLGITRREELTESLASLL